MDARTNTSIGILVILLLSSAVAQSRDRQSRREGVIFVTALAGDCTKTKLQIELDGVAQKPTSVVLRVTRAVDKVEVVKRSLNLSDDGNYYWSGILAPLGKYRAELFAGANESRPLGKPYVFNNIDLLKNFVNERRGEITYISRGGDGEQSGPDDHNRQTLTVDRLPSETNEIQLHIVVINERGNKADEYYGSPPPEGRWQSKPLRFGPYRLIVAGYPNNGNCTIITRR